MTQNNKIGDIVKLCVLMMVSLSGMVMMSQESAASTELKMSDWNLYWFNVYTYSGAWHTVGPDQYLLDYDIGGRYLVTYPGSPKYRTYYNGIFYTTQIGDGQCVSMVKGLASSSVPATDSWGKGRRVIDGGIAPGTAIATFTSAGKYYAGHAAYFREYTKDSYGNINGIVVWDQNWVKSYRIGMHIVKKIGTNTKYDAGAYYVVTV